MGNREQIIIMSAYNKFQNPTTNTITSTKRPQSTVLNFDQEDDSENNIRGALLRESGHITRSEQLLDEQFDIAVKTRETLVNQRWTIKSMQSQYNGITERFQTIGSLIKKIRVRKRRDTIIVAFVFCICLFFLLYHMFF